MTIFQIFVVNRAGGLIYEYQHSTGRTETEKTFSYPLDIKMVTKDCSVTVDFGERDGIKIGFAVTAVNGRPVIGTELDDRTNVLDFINDQRNYPLAIRFAKPALSTNEKIVLASKFYSLFAISAKLSPVLGSSGIQQIDTDSFKVNCLQTQTGIKFIVVADLKQNGIDILLRKLYEIYADYAMKNPFYTIDMPIRCELFELHLKSTVEKVEKFGYLPA